MRSEKFSKRNSYPEQIATHFTSKINVNLACRICELHEMSKSGTSLIFYSICAQFRQAIIECQNENISAVGGVCIPPSCVQTPPHSRLIQMYPIWKLYLSYNGKIQIFLKGRNVCAFVHQALEQRRFGAVGLSN